MTQGLVSNDTLTVYKFTRSLEAIYALLTVYDMADKVKGLRTSSKQDYKRSVLRDVFKVIIDDVDNSQIATKLQEKFDMISTQCLKDPTPQDLEDSSEQETTKHCDDPAFKGFRLFSEIQSLPPKKRYAPMVYEATKKQPEDQLPPKKRLNGFLCSESKRQKTEEPRFENEAVSDVAQFRK